GSPRNDGSRGPEGVAARTYERLRGTHGGGRGTRLSGGFWDNLTGGGNAIIPWAGWAPTASERGRNASATARKRLCFHRRNADATTGLALQTATNEMIPFPTTTVGSFPRSPVLLRAAAAKRRGQATDAEFDA